MPLSDLRLPLRRVESGRVESDPVSARLCDPHIELYLMLVHAFSIMYPLHLRG